MPLSDDQVKQILVDSDAIRHGHFQLTSGRHSDTYVQCARVCEYPDLTNQLAVEAASRLPEGFTCDTVIAPAVGGLVFGYALAQALSVRFIFAERQDGIMTLRRAFEIDPGERVLVAEDVITTGGSVNEVIKVVEEQGGKVIGIVSLIDRGGEHSFDKPFYPLLPLDVASWDPDECNLCKDGIELYSPGSRRLTKSSE
ncbi:MAG: orotate phosphoribosyltransferase [Actinomycetia bacterium]|nr:orotate phosphoribosyltransferase [Actinomycetes bacterium]